MQDLKKDTTKEAPRSSQLSKGRERFLAHVIEHGFEVGRRSPEDFVRHFPPTLIMEGLKDQAKLRADILVQATGVKEKVAIKKSWESCADDLQIALDENETSAGSVMKIFQLDDRVRYLDHKALWAYVTEGEFWKISPSRQKEYAAAKSHMAFMLGRALEDKLVSHQDIVEGITVEELASRLPKSELGKIIKGALECGKRNAPFTETDLLGSMPPDVLVNYMPLFQVWDAIIEPKIAIEHGYTNKKKAEKGDKLPEVGADFGTMPPSPLSPSSPQASAAPLTLDDPPVTASEDDLNAFLPPTSRGSIDEKGFVTSDKDGKALKSRPKTPPPPLPGAALAGTAAGTGKSVEDPSTWSQEFDEDTEFVDAADLLDEEPTINSKIGGKETTV
jgi:hypothetical protein